MKNQNLIDSVRKNLRIEHYAIIEAKNSDIYYVKIDTIISEKIVEISAEEETIENVINSLYTQYLALVNANTVNSFTKSIFKYFL